MNLNHINFFNCHFDDGDGEPNKDFYTERKFLGGWTVSDRHPIKGLKRHAPSELLPSEDIFDISIDDLRMILEDVICNYATDKNVIFLSGGKDSTALAHAFKQLDIPFTPVSLCSKVSTTSEINVVKQIEAELDINVKYFNIDTIPEKNFKYWIENPYTAKVMAVRELGLEKHQLFTGEIGTGEMQINQALQYTAMMGYVPKALSRWHVNVCGSYRRNNSVLDASIDPIYSECVKHFENRFKEWDKHPDVLNRVMFARLQDEGAYRLFNYGIDDLQWVHPFAQDEFIFACANMPSKYKGNKSIYKLMYPSLTEIPWRYPKSGLGIPTM